MFEVTNLVLQLWLPSSFFTATSGVTFELLVELEDVLFSVAFFAALPDFLMMGQGKVSKKNQNRFVVE